MANQFTIFFQQSLQIIASSINPGNLNWNRITDFKISSLFISYMVLFLTIIIQFLSFFLYNSVRFLSIDFSVSFSGSSLVTSESSFSIYIFSKPKILSNSSWSLKDSDMIVQHIQHIQQNYYFHHYWFQQILFL